MPFAVIDPTGAVRTIEADFQRAVLTAGTVAPNVEVEMMPSSEELGDFGAIDPQEMPGVALSNCGLPRISADAVMELSVEKAYERIVGYFPRSRVRKSGEVVKVRAYDAPLSMSRRILGQNYKTSKETPEAPTSVQGLSLLPFNMSKKLSTIPLPGRGLGLCVGSSKMCRKSCLVYSGHNQIDIYNVIVKTARTQALLKDPIAFCRMMVENIQFHQDRGPRLGWEPLVRLNVFSDVPWEMVFPELFTRLFPRLKFYDYTKVPSRNVPPNYDLTFSYSGVNQDYVQHEISRSQRRVAVVFLHPPGVPRLPAVGRPLMYGLPKTFMGLQVVDGDVSDVRPRDPAPSIVGLRYKLPHGQDVDLESAEQRAFVVPVEIVDGIPIASFSSRMGKLTDVDSGDPDAAE